MKKVSGSIFVLLGFLVGMTSGIFGYLSREDDGPELLNWIISMGFFVCSFLHVGIGMRRMKEERAERLAGSGCEDC